MGTTLLALIEQHQHQFPDPVVVRAVFDHVESPEVTQQRIDTPSTTAALAAAAARCMPCQERVSVWLATHGHPRTIVRLTVPIARDAYRLALRWVRAGTPASVCSVARLLRPMLSIAFGREVANVASPLSVGDFPSAVEQVCRLQTERRVLLVRSLLDGIANPPSPELFAHAARRSV